MKPTRRQPYINSSGVPVAPNNLIVPTPNANGNVLTSGGSTQTTPQTIATTGATTDYVIAPVTGTLSAAFFSALLALAASNTNYITFSIVNLGQDGTGTAPLLLATAVNTTKVTGGSAIAVNTVRNLSLNGTASNLAVIQGDRIQILYTVTGTLDNSVTIARTLLVFSS